VAAPTSAIAGGTPSDLYSINVSERPGHRCDGPAQPLRPAAHTGNQSPHALCKIGVDLLRQRRDNPLSSGLAEELQNTIRKIDGILDADVQISFPDSSVTPTPGVPLPKITAAVYIKHQGVMEDPNSHLEVKVKRLMAGSVNGLSLKTYRSSPTVSRFADISLQPEGEMIGSRALQQTYVSIWGLVLTKSFAHSLPLDFLHIHPLLLLFAAAVGWLVYKFYPLLRIKKPETTETPPPGP